MKYVIVGGVAGGATAAARIRRNTEKAEIILFEKGEYISYANCGLPYYIGGYIPSITDAFFETMSGFSSTGATIMNNIESMPHGILFWRAMTQWIGGLGIVFFTIAVSADFRNGRHSGIRCRSQRSYS